MGQAGLVARVGEKRNTYKISVEKSEKKKLIRRPMCCDMKTILKLIFRK
jgi:hypothetical protein